MEVLGGEVVSFYRTSSGVRLCWELEEPKGPKGPYARGTLVHGGHVQNETAVGLSQVGTRLIGGKHGPFHSPGNGTG